MNKENHNEISANNILFYAILLLNFAENRGLSCRYIIDKNGMKFKYGHINSCYMEGQEPIWLKDIIDYIKQTGNIPGALISCNPELLEQFINIIYPNLYQKVEDTLK